MSHRGVPITVINEVLGHSDIKLTQRYVHVAGGQKAGAVEHLSQALAGTELAQTAIAKATKR